MGLEGCEESPWAYEVNVTRVPFPFLLPVSLKGYEGPVLDQAAREAKAKGKRIRSPRSVVLQNHTILRRRLRVLPSEGCRPGRGEGSQHTALQPLPGPCQGACGDVALMHFISSIGETLAVWRLQTQAGSFGDLGGNSRSRSSWTQFLRLSRKAREARPALGGLPQNHQSSSHREEAPGLGEACRIMTEGSAPSSPSVGFGPTATLWLPRYEDTSLGPRP